MEALEALWREENTAIRKNAFQLHAAASKVSFNLWLILIAKYSVFIELAMDVLQSIT